MDHSQFLGEIMPFSFPSNPIVGQTSIQNNRTYQWDGYVWNFINNVAGHANSHSIGGSDAISISASQVSNFNSSVSGILPVVSISSGSGILVSSISGNYIINNTIAHPFGIMCIFS